METKEIMAMIATEFRKGAASTIVVKKSADSSMNKGTAKNRNPFLGRVKVEKTYSGFVMGTDYKASLENTAKRMGNEGVTANLKKVWHKPCEYLGEWFSTDKRTESKVYLKLQRNERQVACKTTSVYYVDGRLATDAEVAAIKGWLKKKSTTMSSTQTEMGIDKEHEQDYLLMQLDTITKIRQGEKVLRPTWSWSVVYA